MRTLVIAAAALLSAPVIAHADPLSAQSSVTLQDAPHTYFAPGVALGGASGHTMGALTFEIGERISDHLVLHVEGLGGGDGELFGGSGNYLAATGGIDATTCNKLEKICAYAGFSAGFAYSKYTESNWFDQNDSMSTLSEGPVGEIRVGFDIGSKHVRWRPGIEAALLGPSQGAVTNAVAFTF